MLPLRPVQNQALDHILLWYPASRIPEFVTDERPELEMQIKLQSGMGYLGEYNHETRSFWIWAERFPSQGNEPKGELEDPEFINNELEPVLEERDDVACWMWQPKPDPQFFKRT